MAIAAQEDQLERDPAEIVGAVPQSRAFRRKQALFRGIKSKSLLTPDALAFMHEVVRVLDARSVLEVGTYFAGATKVLADAVQGRGMVLSIDSNGARAPFVEAEIASWPQAMRDATVFLPCTADDLFTTFQRREEFWFDVCFIDGDHRQTAALGDLLNCARFAGPRAVILVDNSTQPPVFAAVQDFLRLRPDWREVGGAITQHRPDAHFRSIRPSFAGLPFLVLVGPEHPAIGRQLYNAGREIDGPLTGVALDLAVPAEAGRLQGHFALSAVSDRAPVMLVAEAETQVEAGRASVELRLAACLDPGPHRAPRIDYFLSWFGPSESSVLALAGPPQLLTD